MVKSGPEFFILKSYVPLQSCCCPVQKNLPRKAELAWLVSRSRIANFHRFPLTIACFILFQNTKRELTRQIKWYSRAMVCHMVLMTFLCIKYTAHVGTGAVKVGEIKAF